MRSVVPVTVAAWLLFGLWGAACGGNVVVDGDSPGGAGGAGPSTGPGPGSTGPGGATTAGQGGGPATPCQSVCSALALCSDQPAPACAAECAGVNPNCVERHNAWLICLTEQIIAEACLVQTGCEEVLQQYLACEAFCEGGGACWQDMNGGCGCTTGCDDLYETSCAQIGDGLWGCTCIINGEPSGNCQGEVPSGGLGCDITGCCSAFFFVN